MKNRAARRVGARLENGPETVAAIAMTKRLQRVGNRRGMMGEIVDHFYATHFTAHFLPPGDSGKTLERIGDLCFRHVVKSRCRRRHRRVTHIKFADERNFEGFLAKFEL